MQAAVIVKRVDSLHPSNIDQQNYLSNSESFFILLLADDAILEPDTVQYMHCDVITTFLPHHKMIYYVLYVDR